MARPSAISPFRRKPVARTGTRRSRRLTSIAPSFIGYASGTTDQAKGVGIESVLRWSPMPVGARLRLRPAACDRALGLDEFAWRRPRYGYTRDLRGVRTGLDQRHLSGVPARRPDERRAVKALRTSLAAVELDGP
jgi:hypothetical protein